MARKLRTKHGQAVYARRKVIPAPVFGQMKTCQGAGQLLLRGQQAAEAEWKLHATVHNLRNLFHRLHASGPRQLRCILEGSAGQLAHGWGPAPAAA
jgi:hypothetical protein